MTEPLNQETERKPLSLLAAERFGNEFKGESKQPEAKPETAPEAPETPEAPIVDEAVEAQPEAEETAPGAQEEAQTGKEYQLSDLAQLLGVDESSIDVDSDGHVVINKKIDGNVSKAKVSELLKIEQTWEAADKRLSEAKEKAKAIHQEAAAKSEEIQKQFVVAAKLIENVEKSLGDDIANIDWAKLRSDDPAEYAAKMTDITERRKKIETLKQEAASEYTKSQEAARIEANKALQEQLQKENEALLTKIPDWKDEAKSASEKRVLAEYLTKEGFTEEDIKNASDHRLIVMARKAMLYDQGQQKNKVLEKKVAAIPKVIKPGAPKPAAQIAKDKLEQQKNKLKQTGNINDALALMKARRKAS